MKKRILSCLLVLLACVGICMPGLKTEAIGKAEYDNGNASNAWNTGFIVQTPYDQSVYVENGIEFHYVAGDTWQGMMMIVPDPSRVFVGVSRDVYDGGPGTNATRIAGKYGAILATNGTFFVDTDFHGNGGTPLGIVFSEGVCKYGAGAGASALIGLDVNNQPVCGVMTAAQASAAGVRDAMYCKPILVQNGMMTNLSGQSLTLMDARTAIGFRADGSVLILSVDGRSPRSIGATTRSEAECMIAFGAVCAGNLDGGGSCGLYYAGTPINIINVFGNRATPNGFCVRP